MSTINYTYEVVSVDETGKTMEVLYRAVGYSDFRAGVPLPDVGQPAETVIERYAPILEWVEEDRQVDTVAPGYAGQGSANPSANTAFLETQAILDTLPIASNESVQALLAVQTEYLRVAPVHNRESNTVGVELIGPKTQVDAEKGAKMFNSASRVINKAREDGVTVTAISNLQNVIDFLVDIHGMTKIPLLNGAYFMHTPDTEERRASAAAARNAISSLDFMDRFTQQEQELIAATVSNPTKVRVKLMYDRLLTQTKIRYDSPVLKQGLDLLVVEGLITRTRRDELLRPEV